MAGIGDLVAYLGVDSKGFSKGLQSAKSSLSSFAGGISGIIAPVAGVMAGVWGASAAISGAKGALQAQQKLAAVFEATGSAAGLSATEVAAFANDLQAVTNVDADDITEAAASLAAFTNIEGDQFTGILEGAANLSAVMGGDLQSNVKMLGKALSDPATAFGKLEKAGVSFSESQQAQIKSMQASGDLIGAQSALLVGLEDRFGGAAEAIADPWEQLQFALGDVGDAIGMAILPSLNVFSTAMSGVLGQVADGISWLQDFGIEAAVVLSHVGGLLVLGATQWELFFVQAGLGAAHFFTDVIPAYLDWFGRNWSNVLFTMADLAMTVFINIGQNIRNAWQAVLDFFSGNEVNFNWVPLTEGFRSAIDKLPDVPERVTTDFEKSLQRDIEAMSTDLGDSMEKQRSELQKKFNPLSTVPIAPPTTGDEGSAVVDKKPKDLKASFRGSQEAASIMLRGAGGGKSMEQIAQKQLAVQQQLVAAVKDNKPQPMLAANF